MWPVARNSALPYGLRTYMFQKCRAHVVYTIRSAIHIIVPKKRIRTFIGLKECPILSFLTASSFFTIPKKIQNLKTMVVRRKIKWGVIRTMDALPHSSVTIMFIADRMAHNTCPKNLWNMIFFGTRGGGPNYVQ
jgi:Na+/H+-dicarboxylate symporter